MLIRIDLQEKQIDEFGFRNEGSPTVISSLPSSPSTPSLQTATLIAISNKYGHIFVASPKEVLHSPTHKLHGGNLGPKVDFSKLSIS